MFSTRSLAFALGAIASFSTFAQPDIERFSLVHQQAQISLDGDISEFAWQNATKISLDVQNEPLERAPAPVKTDALLFEDGKYLYIAFYAYDPAPNAIRGALRDRDELWQDDNVGIIIDSLNDERNAFEFFVNAYGAQGDILATDYDTWIEDPSWDAIWQSNAKIQSDGYTVEMRIPLNVLNLPKTDEAITWGISLARNYPRDSFYRLSNVGFDLDIKCSFCQFDKLTGLENRSQDRDLLLAPYISASRSESKTEVPGPWTDEDTDIEVGADLRWRVNDQTLVNATINPDFSQIEADAVQLDVNTNFSLFYAEKRPFFLDGSSYFRTNQLNLLYTRTIAEPEYGAKVTSKTGAHTFAAMLADDINPSVLIPSNQGSSLVRLDEDVTNSVARYRYDVGQRSGVGMMVTHRQGDEYHNTVAAVDGTYALNDSDSINYAIAHSDTQNTEIMSEFLGLGEKQRGQAFSLAVERVKRDYLLSGQYEQIDEDFRADMGYQPKSNFKEITLGGGQIWYGKPDAAITRWQYEVEWDKSYDFDGNVLMQEYDAFVYAQGPLVSTYELGFWHNDELYLGEYYQQNNGYFEFSIRPLQDLSYSLYADYGSRIDYSNAMLGQGSDIENSLSWDVTEHLQLQANYNFSKLDVDNDPVFRANQWDLRLYYKFNIRSMLKVIWQYEDIDRNQEAYRFYQVHKRNRDFGSQVVYSYTINPQSVFYLGYSDAGYQDDDLDELERTDRTFFTKISYAWQL